MKMTSFLKMYGHVLRLAAILLLIPLDTSECERIRAHFLADEQHKDEGPH